MKFINRSALLLSFGLATALPMAGLAPLGSGIAFAQALSAAVGKPLQQARSQAQAGNTSAAMNSVNQARSAAKSPAERTAVGQMAAYVYNRAGQYAQAATELERIGANPRMLAPLYYQARQYDKAIDAARKSGQTTIVAQSYLMQGKAADAARIYADLVAKNPSNLNYLTNLAGAQFRAGDKEAYLATTQKLVRLDPSPNRWKVLLTQLKAAPMSRDAKLGLYHLMRETGTLTDTSDVQELAKLAIVGGQPGIAVDAVKAATAAGTMQSDSMANRLVEAGTKRQQAAMTAAPGQARSPDTAYKAGNAFIGSGMYPQAIAAFDVAQKGPNATQAALFKGISQVRSGSPAEARKTFQTISGGGIEDVAELWALYASTKG